MDKSLNEWAFPAEMPMAQMLALARTAGFAGFEVALAEDPDGSLRRLGRLTVEDCAAQARAIHDLAEEESLRISAVAVGLGWKYSLTADDPTVRAHALEITAAALEAAQILGAGAILVIPGVVDASFAPQVPPVSYEVCYARLLEAMAQLLPIAENRQVQIGLEPVWNMFLLSPLEWVRLIDELASDWARVYFDVGNVMPTGYPEQWIRLLGPRICRVHCKDFKRAVGTLDGFCHLLEGDVNYPAVMAALREVGYDGWLTAEIMPPLAVAPDYLVDITAQAVDRILKM
jgi:L-ribulose-5-phosphate 3-epimerase